MVVQRACLLAVNLAAWKDRWMVGLLAEHWVEMSADWMVEWMAEQMVALMDIELENSLAALRAARKGCVWAARSVNWKV